MELFKSKIDKSLAVFEDFRGIAFLMAGAMNFHGFVKSSKNRRLLAKVRKVLRLCTKTDGKTGHQC